MKSTEFRPGEMVTWSNEVPEWMKSTNPSPPFEIVGYVPERQRSLSDVCELTDPPFRTGGANRSIPPQVMVKMRELGKQRFAAVYFVRVEDAHPEEPISP